MMMMNLVMTVDDQQGEREVERELSWRASQD
jgi:hypothetical protein